MKSEDIRKTYLDFFAEKGHKIVQSAPIVVKNDPTLLFTNAGMNQFKDYFLGNKKAEFKRIADTQKCLRVSGKHNDLEEVGIDTYHHTMFEMLGNWSFGDYFKQEAISWAWELLTERYKLDKTRLYVTIFEGDAKEGLEEDTEALEIWSGLIQKDHILRGNKKDNFWEMGDTGPCGPCTEIHYDIRPENELTEIPGADLVNNDHPQVIEIWNNVFIQYDRKWKKEGAQKELNDYENSLTGDDSEKKKLRSQKHIELTVLEPLPDKHVDTGMGFERLTRVLQGKSSNYDTDIFQPIIKKLEKDLGFTYGKDEKTDIAARVISDHIRAVTFTIADGQLPSNTGAGYVIRRILRRAVRYGYSFLKMEEPYIHQLVTVLAQQFKNVFPEVIKQEDFIKKVILEEETSFLRTLSKGINRFNEQAKSLRSKDS
ncbi:MAG: alanine--tRNA ligase, partial [Bacteroidia bacterium]